MVCPLQSSPPVGCRVFAGLVWLCALSGIASAQMPMPGQPPPPTGPARPLPQAKLPQKVRISSTPDQGGLFGRTFVLRHDLRAIVSRAKTLAHGGQLSAAAASLPDRQGADLAWREQRAVKKVEKRIFDDIVSALRSRTKKGDTFGAKDALDALKIYRQGHNLGWWSRFRAWRAERKAVKNIYKRVKYAGRRQDIQNAAENVALLSSLRGENDPKVKKAINQLHKYALKAAKHAARNGSPPGAMQALQMAAQAAAASGKQLDQGKAEKIMRLAYKRGVGAYVWQARTAYKKGEYQAAAQMLLESLEIQENPQLGFKPGFFARRQQAKLLRKLGPHLAAARQARAEQMAQAQAEQEAMERQGAEGAEEEEEAQAQAGPTPQPAPQPRGFVAPPRPDKRKDLNGRPMPGAVEVVEPVGPSPMDPGPG